MCSGCSSTHRFLDMNAEHPSISSKISLDVGTKKEILLISTNQDSVAGSVIQASGMVLFEDALEAGTLGVDIWSAPSVRTTPVVKLAP